MCLYNTNYILLISNRLPFFQTSYFKSKDILLQRCRKLHLKYSRCPSIYSCFVKIIDSLLHDGKHVYVFTIHIYTYKVPRKVPIAFDLLNKWIYNISETQLVHKVNGIEKLLLTCLQMQGLGDKYDVAWT